MKALERLALRLYRTIASGFPAEFRGAHGNQMVQLTEDIIRDAARKGGMRRLVPVTLRVLADALVRLAAEHASEFAQDVRYGARTLARSPGFTLAAMVCLGIGIGLTASTFSQVRSGILRELPHVRDPGALVTFQAPVSHPNYEEFRDESGQFESLAAYMGPVPFVIRTAGQPHRVWGHLVTPDYFDVLGTRAVLGRTFSREEALPGSAPAAVVSHRLWQARFGGDRDILGRIIRVNGQPVSVIGVAPEQFLGAMPLLSAADLWIPTTAQARVAPELARDSLADRRVAVFRVIGRLRPGIAPAEAETALEGMARRLEQAHNDPGKDRKERRVVLLAGGRVLPVRDRDLPVLLAFPAVLVGLILLIACANIATMQVARGAARHKEIAIRLALGAGRPRLVRQLLTESMLLAALGGAAGVLFAWWHLASLERVKPILPSQMDWNPHLDWRALLVALAVAAASGLLFGLAPALQTTRAGIAPALKAGSALRLRAHRWFSLRNILVLQQVAASLTLLLLTGFVVLGFQRSKSIEMGFDPHNLYLMSLDPVRDGYSGSQAAEFFERLPERIRRVPGVRAAGLAQSAPLAMFSGESLMASKMEITGGPRLAQPLQTGRVGAGFFETVQVPVLTGRPFHEQDQREDSRAILVNETVAKGTWPGQSAVGQVVELEGATYEVVGVAGDIRPGFVMEPPRRCVYLPLTPSGFGSPSPQGVTLMVRTEPGVDAAVLVRREIAAMDPDLTVFNASSMSDQVRQMTYVLRAATAVYGGMGLFGLVLASVALAGVTAYAVARRTHEIGIRVALGADRADVLRLVLREGAALVLAGTVLGLAAALAAVRVLNTTMSSLSEMTQTSTSDPLLLAGAPLLLAGLALLACYLPARRATRLDPLAALRSE